MIVSIKKTATILLTKSLLISLILITIYSCQANLTQEVSFGNQNKKWLNKTNSAKGIHFIYTASKINSYKGELEVNASLYNDYLDTAFFLSSSCDGIIYSLRYDTTEMDIIPQILCNASFPIILAIPPKEKIDFTFFFGFKKQISSLKLGIDYYSVDKSFKLKEHPEIDLSEILYRPKYEQVVIWGDEKTIN
jgi:hypothetical protein